MSSPARTVIGAATSASAADTAARAASALPHVRVGCDVQCVEAVAHAVRHFGSRYLDRVYTSAEQDHCRAGGHPSLAGRFAAKEAVLKLLGSADGIDPREVEITSRLGRPEVHLSGSASSLARNLGLTAIDVSISHDAGVAFAVAVAEPHRPTLPDHLTHSGDHR